MKDEINPLKLNNYKGNILVVDDTPENSDMLGEILREKGYRVQTTNTGELALSSVRKFQPNLILLDIVMPDMDGYQICSQLKVNEKTREIPVIFIQGVSEILDRVKAFAVGGVDYIIKPFQVPEVLARVETQLALQNLQKSLECKDREFAKILEQLTSTQSQLIASEKMAVLGQLIAGIAHEINTPLGAISASISNIYKSFDNVAKQLPQLCQQLSAEQLVNFFSLSAAARENLQAISFREERKLKRAFQQALESQGVEDADTIAATLVKMGFTQDISSYIPLLKTNNSALIIEVAYNMAVQQQNSTNIMLAVERASKLVLALKSYARYDNSGERIESQVSEGIDLVLTIYQNQLKHGIETIKNYAEVPAILCYPEELHQVWTNLIHNAIQAMDGKGKLQIDVLTQDRYIVVRVTDSGCGIPVQIKDQIFEPFFTTKPSGEGSGLGLDIVRKIIDKHCGRIEVNSVPGNTTFTVYLPLDELDR